MAQESTAAATPWYPLAGPLGAGLVIIGAAYGIGRLAASALESMARQPEVAGSIQTAMIIAAARARRCRSPRLSKWGNRPEA